MISHFLSQPSHEMRGLDVVGCIFEKHRFTHCSHGMYGLGVVGWFFCVNMVGVPLFRFHIVVSFDFCDESL